MSTLFTPAVSELKAAYKSAYKAGNTSEGARIYDLFRTARQVQEATDAAAHKAAVATAKAEVASLLPNTWATATHKTLVDMAVQAAKTGKAYTVTVSGSGKFTKNLDHTAKVVAILEANGYKVSIGNDAPRGGKAGTFITASK